MKAIDGGLVQIDPDDEDSDFIVEDANGKQYKEGIAMFDWKEDQEEIVEEVIGIVNEYLKSAGIKHKFNATRIVDGSDTYIFTIEHIWNYKAKGLKSSQG